MTDDQYQCERAADLFHLGYIHRKNSVFGVAGCGLTIVSDIAAGRTRSLQAFEAFTKRYLKLVNGRISNENKALLTGVAILVNQAGQKQGNP